MQTEQLTTALLAHFDRHRRDLPWRRTRDPYAIWISEVMLQQTRVESAVPYYERWMERFPTVEALADAGLDDVLHLWQGLGYYSRARNLHSAARRVRERHQGTLPADLEALRKLPGVGEYTAGAVASIAFDIATPAVDGNVRRVLCRIHDLQDATPAELRRLAAELVPRERPGDFNQALMELGATVCTPRAPACGSCPVRPWCGSAAAGTQALRPRPRRRGPLPEEEVTTLVLIDLTGHYLLVRRPPHGLLGGLWEFPAAGTRPAVDRLARHSAGDLELESVAHAFSHKRIVYRPRIVRVAEPGEAPGDECEWVGEDDLAAYAMPVAQQRIAALVAEALGGGRSGEGGG